MTKQIKIFDSEKEVKGLEGTFIKHKLINTELNNPMLWLFHSIAGEFTPMQRLKSRTRWEAKLLRADYATITNTYETYGNLSGHLQNIEDCHELQTIEVNFYKNKLK